MSYVEAVTRYSSSRFSGIWGGRDDVPKRRERSETEASRAYETRACKPCSGASPCREPVDLLTFRVSERQNCPLPSMKHCSLKGIFERRFRYFNQRSDFADKDISHSGVPRILDKDRK